MPLASLCLFLLALVVVSPGPLPAQVSDTTATPTVFRSHGDIRNVNVEEELAELIDANEALVGDVERKSVSFPAAIAKARELARGAVTPASLAAALQALPDNTTTTLRLFAFAQVAAGKPTAAFAILVAAQQRDEPSPDLLADLAGMLAGFGYPNEALAILDELARRNAIPTPPMGISGSDALDYVRGYALARVGEKPAALSRLRALADREPQLAEAARMVAILTDDDAERRKYFLLGVWRHRSPLMVCAGVDRDSTGPDALTTGSEVAIDVRSLIDPGKAKRGRQPTMRYAKNVNQANDLVPKMDAAKRAAQDRDSAILQQRGKRPKPYIHTDTAIEDTWGYRIQQLVSSIHFRDAKLRELDQRRRVLWREREAARRMIEDERTREADAAVKPYMEECIAKRYDPTSEQIGEKMRPAFEAALGRMAPYINREEMAEREWFAEWHFLATGLAAQVGDPAWHEFISLSIEAERWRSYGRLLHLVQMHASVGQNPLIVREPGEVSTEPEEDPAEKCDSSKSLSFGTNTLPGGTALPFEFGVEMTCEGMSLEAAVDTRIPGISLSAEIGGDKNGNFTAFVGPKAEVAVGEKEIAAFTGSAKAGAYVTGNKHGVSDAGVKYEVKAGAKVGAFSTAQKVAEGNVSFFPAPVPSSGDFGALGG